MTDAAFPFPFPTLYDIRDAAAVLAPHLVRTPLLRSDALDRRTGGKIFLKAEILQRTGSFKFRGAMNRISRLHCISLTLLVAPNPLYTMISIITKK